MTLFDYLQYLKVQRGISCFGMSKDQLEVMAQVGYDRWLAEYTPEAPKAPVLTGTRRCALGSKCFNAHARKAAFGTGKYCSAICKGAAQTAKRQEKATWQAENPGMVAIS